MYVIRLKNCAFFANHGVYEEEKNLGQRFYVDVELCIIASDALDADDVSQTVDYGDVFKEVEAIIQGSRRFLIETLALDIAKRLCACFAPVQHARVVLRKPNAPIRGVLEHVEVEVTWSKSQNI